MNDKKIAFITCVNDDIMYEECLRYINNLDISSGYEIDVISIKEAKCITAAYNGAIKNTDAKYKVYLHQDTFIINRNFIHDILKIFKEDEKVGMIGVVGSKTIPTNGVWWESQQKYGKVYEKHTGNMELLNFNEVINEYEEVKAIDGLIMVTQYDVTWREDIFDGWHFYDISQSVEFNLADYKVVVPMQNKPWCIHDCELVNIKDHDIYRSRFLEEYSVNIFPLVSILIPTYNRPKYFELALKSALNQTYKNIEIIIGDDSTNDETERIVTKKYLKNYNSITYYHNEKNLGQFDNDLKLVNLAKGNYINFLMDDDLFEASKIEKMMNYFVQDFNNEFSLVTSHRGNIDENGALNGIFGNTDGVFKKNTVTDGIKFGNSMLKTNYNFMGEPTTVLFRKNKLKEPFGVYNSRQYGCNVDQASWLNLLSNGKAVFINEVLSYFRIHGNQQLASDKMKLLGALDYAHEVRTAREKGFLRENRDFSKAVSLCLKYCQSVIEYFDNIAAKEEFTHKIREINGECRKLKKIINEENNKLPLVSILIPAYNQTKYLKEALESAINQTYSNIEIIIGDDSTTDEVEKFISPYLYAYDNIMYFKNKNHEMDYGISNSEILLEKSKGEYVNYLFHDDIFDITKIEKMMKCFIENPDITLVTSARQPIDENNKKLPLNGAFKRLFDKDSLVSGYEMNRYMVTNLINCIGEPTTVLFKKRYIEENKFGLFNKIFFCCNVDVAAWATLLQYGDMVYISEILSYFRVHSEQNSNKPQLHIKGVIDWYSLIRGCYKIGIIQNNYEYKIILDKWMKTFSTSIINTEKLFDCKNEILEELEQVYHTAVSDMFKNKNSNKLCLICENEVERFLPYQYKDHISDFTYKYNVIGSDIENLSCPHCYCHDRERHLMGYFNRLDMWSNNIIGKKVLHIAPEKYIQKFINNLNTEEYVCGDLYPINNSIIKMDITDIEFENNYFDFIICNHVLEHIPNDLKAMKELYRVLNHGGYAVLQTPYSITIDKSFEIQNIDTPELRKKYFGQSDHVRIYGKDLFEKIITAGFKLKLVNNNEVFTNEEVERYGVNDRENLILVFKE